MIAADMQMVVRRSFFMSLELIVLDYGKIPDGAALCVTRSGHERDFSVQWIKIKFLYK
jgi:hypothetical protein